MTWALVKIFLKDNWQLFVGGLVAVVLFFWLNSVINNAIENWKLEGYNKRLAEEAQEQKDHTKKAQKEIREINERSNQIIEGILNEENNSDNPNYFDDAVLDSLRGKTANTR